jgi:hypothetical protein
MAKAKVQKRPLDRKRHETIAVLERYARSRGLKVASGKLVFAGLKLRSGKCVYRDEPWLVIDSAQPYGDQLDLFRKAFEELGIEGHPEDVEAILRPDGLGIR